MNIITKKDIKILLPILLILGIFVYFADPRNGPIFPCIFNEITGLYCPGCGMTRAVNSILRFDFYQALRYNALIFMIPPMFVAYYLLEGSKYKKLSKAIIILMIIIALGYGLIRNTEIFSYLAPVNI
ncbi:DUF2752 domain-containing protein [Tissierella sp.]|uniref:DUF2752 domain-containing protein n=1 Tax=Tissierella sp. TaxID=41274 RepID=UPI00285A79C2|nr:DUF2752 domain-containing protein [Tissierella sp.]MDR7855475.1 DUF2752 domain-containing protein [Tissierella sp.]